MGKSRIFNYFKHVPDDLVITSPLGMAISAVGTVILLVLFLFELQAYMSITVVTDLVVDELVDETLRVNFNVTLHQVCPPLRWPRWPPRGDPPLPVDQGRTVPLRPRRCLASTSR